MKLTPSCMFLRSEFQEVGVIAFKARVQQPICAYKTVLRRLSGKCGDQDKLHFRLGNKYEFGCTATDFLSCHLKP